MAVIGWWPLLGGGRYLEVHHIGNDMGKCLELNDGGRCWKVAAIQRWPLVEVRLYYVGLMRKYVKNRA